MTASIVDTDQLPRILPAAAGSGGPEPVGDPEGCGRRALREERRQRRRRRRLYAAAGLAVLGVLLVATVIVLDMVR